MPWNGYHPYLSTFTALDALGRTLVPLLAFPYGPPLCGRRRTLIPFRAYD